MRRVIGIVVASLALGVLLLWGVGNLQPLAAQAEAQSAAVGATQSGVRGAALTLAVPSMTCGSCEGRIRAALERRAGVREVAVDVGSRTVRVVYDPAAADPKALADAVTGAGYPARYLPEGAEMPRPRRSGGGCGGGCCDNKG